MTRIDTIKATDDSGRAASLHTDANGDTVVICGWVEPNDYNGAEHFRCAHYVGMRSYKREPTARRTAARWAETGRK